MGVQVAELHDPTQVNGFPVAVELKDGRTLLLDLPNPALVDVMDREHIGVAILDLMGHARKTWGMARRIPYFQFGESCINSEIGPLIDSALQGVPGSLYLDGVRYYVGAIGPEICVFVTNAAEEKVARRQANKSWREANALKRVGKQLTMNQQLIPLCHAVVHEIASSTELAAVLLWTIDSDEHTLKLSACTGANRQGTATLQKIDAESTPTCIAELVAMSRQPFFLNSVLDHVMTADLEAKFCYLKPGGLSVHPLVISDRVLGVLELVGKESDPHFAENLELFQTLAEHLALALNSAIMFETFERMATHDALTGIANHRTMQEFLHQRIAEAHRSGQPLGVMMLDVDHFRSFNEEEGHEAGDTVLKMVAETMRNSLRQYDLAARYGGEEFTVILPGSNRDITMRTAERIRLAIERAPFVARSGRVKHVTASIGCSEFPATAQDSTTLLKAADMALYEAKRNGRNRVEFYEGTFSADAPAKHRQWDAVWTWIPDPMREDARDHMRSCRPFLTVLAERLDLSQAQENMLEALVSISSAYLYQRDHASEADFRRIQESEEHRLLGPCLLALEERYDGRGPNRMAGAKIPMLTRALHVVEALAMGGGELLRDPERFDPEIVALATNLEDAA